MNQQELKEKLRYDPDTGEFVRLGKTERLAGTTSIDGRRVICVNYKLYKAHRLAWLYMMGEWPKGDIDHIDGNPSNNRIANLRDVTRAINMQNLKRARADSSSGCIGASKAGGKYVAEIAKDGTRITLGRFKTAAEASAAYIAAKRILHSEGNTL